MGFQNKKRNTFSVLFCFKQTNENRINNEEILKGLMRELQWVVYTKPYAKMLQIYEKAVGESTVFNVKNGLRKPKYILDTHNTKG